MRLGTSSDGRPLAYDEARYEFTLGGSAVPLSAVLSLDEDAGIRWRALEQRDWLHRIDPEALEACRAEALGSLDLDSLSPEQRVLADAARDDGVLAGKLVEADPALVQAVAYELEKRGMARGGTPAAAASASAAAAGQGTHAGNPLAERELPRGMEALSQMERAREVDRPMTRLEKRLMKRILRNDDKAKSKLERQAARRGAGAGDAKADGEGFEPDGEG